MLKAEQIKNLIPKGGSLTLNIAETKDGSSLTVIVHQKHPKEKGEGVNDRITKIREMPLVVTATPEELDKQFMEFLKQATDKVNSIEQTLKEIDATGAKTIEEAKKSAEKRVETGKKAADHKANSKEKGRATVAKDNTTKKESATASSEARSAEGKDASAPSIPSLFDEPVKVSPAPQAAEKVEDPAKVETGTLVKPEVAEGKEAV